MAVGEPLAAGPNCLLVFIDDTGNESFGGQRYFGLGGIIVLASEHEALLKPRWKALRATIRGSEVLPLHASTLGHHGNMSQLDAVSAFFSENRFARFGVVTTTDTTVPDVLTPRQPVYEILKKFIGKAVFRSMCESVALIFESSQRADPILKAEFGSFIAIRDDVELPVEHCVMPKSANEPGLEVADFVANSVGSMARWTLKSRKGFPKDFQAVFHSVPDNLAQYMYITSVLGAPGDENAAGYELRARE